MPTDDEDRVRQKIARLATDYSMGVQRFGAVATAYHEKPNASGIGSTIVPRQFIVPDLPIVVRSARLIELDQIAAGWDALHGNVQPGQNWQTKTIRGMEKTVFIDEAGKTPDHALDAQRTFMRYSRYVADDAMVKREVVPFPFQDECDKIVLTARTHVEYYLVHFVQTARQQAGPWRIPYGWNPWRELFDATVQCDAIQKAFGISETEVCHGILTTCVVVSDTRAGDFHLRAILKKHSAQGWLMLDVETRARDQDVHARTILEYDDLLDGKHKSVRIK